MEGMGARVGGRAIRGGLGASVGIGAAEEGATSTAVHNNVLNEGMKIFCKDFVKTFLKMTYRPVTEADFLLLRHIFQQSNSRCHIQMPKEFLKVVAASFRLDTDFVKDWKTDSDKGSLLQQLIKMGAVGLKPETVAAHLGRIKTSAIQGYYKDIILDLMKDNLAIRLLGEHNRGHTEFLKFIPTINHQAYLRTASEAEAHSVPHTPVFTFGDMFQ